jgi:hypothetical protein
LPVAAAIAGAAIVGGGVSLIEGNKAAHAQKDSAAAQITEQRREYDQDRTDLQPYRETGTAALSKLAQMYGVAPAGGVGGTGTASGPGGTGYANDGGFTASPGYKFSVDQGIQAAERAAAAGGRLSSGGTVKAIGRYVTGAASTEYDQYASRLAQLAGVGQSATNSTVAAGQGTTTAITQAQQQAGNARASSYANTGSAVNGTVNNLASAYLYSRAPSYGVGGAYGIQGSGGYY